MNAKIDFDNFICEHEDKKLHTKSHEKFDINVQRQIDKHSKEYFNNKYDWQKHNVIHLCFGKY